VSMTRLSSASPTRVRYCRPKRDQLEDSAIVSDGPRLVTAHAEVEEAQNKVDTLYALGRAGEKEELSFSLFSRSLNLIGVWQQQ
jgi:hypothetical protein